MKTTQVTYLFLAIIAMLFYNTFLIQRDAELFNSYDNRQQQIYKQLKTFHPDCQ